MDAGVLRKEKGVVAFFFNLFFSLFLLSDEARVPASG